MLHRSKSDVDILVRPSTYEKTKDLLRSANLDYEILIDDLGKRIELENPKISEETAELVGRQGKSQKFFLTSRCPLNYSKGMRLMGY